MARKYVCKGSNKACTSDVTHACDQTCSDCIDRPPCTFSDVRFPCAECNSILENARVSINTSGALRRNVTCANENDVARHVDES